VYVLDTNVISELRKNKPHGAVLAWLQTVNAHQLFLSAVTIGEIQEGIETTKVQDVKKAQEIEAWLEKIIDGWKSIQNLGSNDARSIKYNCR
jgi:toxin FitB